MSAERTVIPGVVKNGLVVPQGDTSLPEGASVEIVIVPPEESPELQAELDAWDRAGDEAWAQIDRWEREEGTGLSAPSTGWNSRPPMATSREDAGRLSSSRTRRTRAPCPSCWPSP